MLHVTLIVPMPHANAFNQIAALGNTSKLDASAAPEANPSQQLVVVTFQLQEEDLGSLQQIYRNNEGIAGHIILAESIRGDEADEIIRRNGLTNPQRKGGELHVQLSHDCSWQGRFGDTILQAG